jgi:hypothetical protein
MRARHVLAGAALVGAVAHTAIAEGTGPIVARPPSVTEGDGRAIAPVAVSGSLPVAGKQLPVVEVATLACEGAASLPAVDALEPAVLVPFVTGPTTIPCVARLRASRRASP